jgi:hypothetical protein
MRALKNRSEIAQCLGKLDFELADERISYSRWYKDLNNKDKKYLDTKLKADEFVKRNKKDSSI